jgi:uncharacterized protein with PIN domain
MLPNNCDPALTHLDRAPEEGRCPKCGVEMEPIQSSIEELPVQELQLCPRCYLVIWRDAAGFQIRQGVPMKKDAGNSGIP